MSIPTNYVPATKPCSQQLRYQFNDDELKERGKKLAETHSKLASLELDKKRIVTSITAQVSAVKAEAGNLAEMVSTGYEVRDIPCTATMDTPTIGKKTIRRDDTGEEVEVQPMTPSENSEAQDARAKAEYDLKNPVLDLEEVKPEEPKTDEKTLPDETDEPKKDGAGEPLSDEEKAKLTGKGKKKKAAATPDKEF